VTDTTQPFLSDSGIVHPAGTPVLDVCPIEASLAGTKTLVDFLALEGRAAQIYWDPLVEIPLPWRPWAPKRPAHWASISPRTSGRRDRARDATDPFNAVLSYCYTLLEVETRVAREAVGLDPDLGLLRTEDRARVVRVRPPGADAIEARRLGLRPDVQGEAATSDAPRAAGWRPPARSGSGRPVGSRPDAAVCEGGFDLANDYAKQLRGIAQPRRLVREAPKPVETAARVLGTIDLWVL
jgi:hypothetical protein